eukprot:2602621-Pleurochrysis_carterae.AAC.2
MERSKTRLKGSGLDGAEWGSIGVDPSSIRLEWTRLNKVELVRPERRGTYLIQVEKTSIGVERSSIGLQWARRSGAELDRNGVELDRSGAELDRRGVDPTELDGAEWNSIEV